MSATELLRRKNAEAARRSSARRAAGSAVAPDVAPPRRPAGVGRVTQNKIELRKKVLDLSAVVREAAAAVHDLMAARRLTFSVEIDPSPLRVEGDPARLQQIQVNLLSNAAKYTEPGATSSSRLRARTRPRSSASATTGPGFRLRCSTRSSTSSSSRAGRWTAPRRARGRLTLVRSLVTMHGGTVVAASRGIGLGAS